MLILDKDSKDLSQKDTQRGGPSPQYPSIQPAIDASASGDKVQVQAHNNIFYHNRISICGTPQQLVEDYNCHHDSFCPPMYSSGSHNLNRNPRFVDADNHKYKLKSGSPCVDAGAALPGYNDGYSGSAPDIGAFEQQG